MAPKQEPDNTGFDVVEHRLLGTVVPGRTLVTREGEEYYLGPIEAAYLLIGQAQEKSDDAGDTVYQFTIPTKYNGLDAPLEIKVRVSTTLAVDLDDAHKE